MKNWESLSAFFSVINENVDYVVLRNFEYFVNDHLLEDHPDIDFLCRDSSEFIRFACSVPRTQKKDNIHHRIQIAGKDVNIDIRHIGDGYYDKSWETNILNNRHIVNGLCYVMDEENYFYTLLYHVLIQKHRIADDYKERLEMLWDKLNRGGENPLSIGCLQGFMRERNYSFTYPEFPGAIANFSAVDKAMIKRDYHRIIRRAIYAIYRRFHFN